MISYVKLTIATLLPVLLASILFLLEKHTKFNNVNNKAKQILCGILFGGLAILGTEWGIPMSGGAVANCRDGAVMIAGLMFGGPAGIIAGVIGGVERWFAVYWGAGEFTRIACSVSTIIAGFYSALLRKILFENKKPQALSALASGFVMEVFHLTMVFVTNIDTPEKAFDVVMDCNFPLLISNSCAVFFAAIILSLLDHNKSKEKTKLVHISETIQKRMLLAIVATFIVTSGFVVILQVKLTSTQTENTLTVSLEDCAKDVRNFSDSYLLSLAHRVVDVEDLNGDLAAIEDKYGLAEVSIINKKGIIERSSHASYIGFNMNTGEQSREFLSLLTPVGASELVQSYGSLSSNSSTKRKYAAVRIENGFVQIGISAASLQKELKTKLTSYTKNTHVGKTGYILILDKNNELISVPDHVSINVLRHDVINLDYHKYKENETFNARSNASDCFAQYVNIEGYNLIALYPKSEAQLLQNLVILVNIYMEVLAFAVLFTLIFILDRDIIVSKIHSFNESLGKITKGDLDEVVNVRSNYEYSSLSDDINSTVTTLKGYIAEANERIDKELELAKDIQASALPNIFPAFPKRKDFDIFALMDPAKEVGGDFYDLYITNQDTLHFLVADTSGKGIPAAMFMMRAKTELKTLTESGISISDVFTRGNNALCEGNDAGMFVTAWQGSIDLDTGVLRFANAGHNPPLLCPSNGKFEYLRSRTGFVLAGMEGVPYKEQEIHLHPGDTVFLYTDGVTEATNSENELYGENRLKDALNSRLFKDSKDMCEFIKQDVDAFVGDAPQFDDITMLAFRFNGKPVDPSITIQNATLQDITNVTEFVEDTLAKIHCDMKSIIQINVAIDELFSNIVRYGYPKEPGPVTVKVVEKQSPHAVCIRFEDEGIPYNPLTKEDPDTTLSVENRQIGGLGIYMVKKTMDSMKYKYENGKNILTISKTLED